MWIVHLHEVSLEIQSVDYGFSLHSVKSNAGAPEGWMREALGTVLVGEGVIFTKVSKLM